MLSHVKNVWKRAATLAAATVAITASGMTAQAAPIWGSSAQGELSGSRNSSSNGGVTGFEQWDNGGFNIAWDISFDQDTELWTYEYHVTVGAKDVSHILFEVTETDKDFLVAEGSDDFKEIKTWKKDSGGNPNLPNDIYAGKFDYGDKDEVYTIVTDRAPVYGVFYAKDGKNGGDDVVAWANALNEEDYKTNEDLALIDFIARPDGKGGFVPPPDPGGDPDPPPTNAVPEPVTASLSLMAGAGLAMSTWRRRRR